MKYLDIGQYWCSVFGLLHLYIYIYIYIFINLYIRMKLIYLTFLLEFNFQPFFLFLIQASV